MDHNFPEAIDALLVDNAIIRRSCNNKMNDKYIGKRGACLLYVDGSKYTPSDADIFADDWQIFGKGVLGRGPAKKKK